MIEILKTDAYTNWFEELRDFEGRARINKRLKRIRDAGNFGDAKTVGDGVFEIRLHFGPGYRIYYIAKGQTVIFLLGGGDKDSQERDIEKAKMLADELRKDWNDSEAEE